MDKLPAVQKTRPIVHGVDMTTKDPIKRREYNQRWRLANKEHRNAQARKYNWAIKLRTLEAYGNVCFCCGESNPKFLSIDHVDGGGNTHRKQLKTNGGTGLYQWLKKNNYPDGFQVLCFNCNCAKGFYGICPHMEEQSEKETLHI